MSLQPIPTGLKVTKCPPGPIMYESRFQRYAHDDFLGEAPGIHKQELASKTPYASTFEATMAALAGIDSNLTEAILVEEDDPDEA